MWYHCGSCSTPLTVLFCPTGAMARGWPEASPGGDRGWNPKLCRPLTGPGDVGSDLCWWLSWLLNGLYDYFCYYHQHVCYICMRQLHRNIRLYVQIGILDNLREGLAWLAWPFQPLESNVLIYGWSWCAILPPVPCSLASPPPIQMVSLVYLMVA